jgi:rhodanese-related sulfurtransferase
MDEQHEEAQRIDAAEVVRRLRGGEPIALVCAYDSDVAWRKLGLAGAWPLSALGERADEVGPDGIVVLYCRCPREKTSDQAARALRARGFGGARVLAGGYEAALAAGLRPLRRP